MKLTAKDSELCATSATRGVSILASHTATNQCYDWERYSPQ
jgi:hypothetical protein